MQGFCGLGVVPLPNVTGTVRPPRVSPWNIDSPLMTSRLVAVALAGTLALVMALAKPEPPTHAEHTKSLKVLYWLPPGASSGAYCCMACWKSTLSGTLGLEGPRQGKLGVDPT